MEAWQAVTRLLTLIPDLVFLEFCTNVGPQKSAYANQSKMPREAETDYDANDSMPCLDQEL